MSSDGIYPGVLRELVDVIARPLLVIFENPWCSEEISKGWKKPATMRLLSWWMRAEEQMLLISTSVRLCKSYVSHNTLIDKLMKYRLGNWM